MDDKTKSAALLIAVPLLILVGSCDFPKAVLDVLAPIAAAALIALYVGWMRVLRCCTREYD